MDHATPDLGAVVNGVIVFDETIRQQRKDGAGADAMMGDPVHAAVSSRTSSAGASPSS